MLLRGGLVAHPVLPKSPTPSSRPRKAQLSYLKVLRRRTALQVHQERTVTPATLSCRNIQVLSLEPQVLAIDHQWPFLTPAVRRGRGRGCRCLVNVKSCHQVFCSASLIS